MPSSFASTRLISGVTAVAVGAFLALAPPAGAQSLPAGWSLTDIGGPPAPGSASQSAATLSISSRGWDVSGTSDQFTFVSTPASGDLSLVAKVSSLQNADPWSAAGLMIRESLGAGSSHVSVFVTPSNGVVVRGRASSLGGTVQMTVGSGAAPVWLRLDRRSSKVTLYRSADGVVWTLDVTLEISLTNSVVVGLAVASHSTTASVAASVTGLSLNGIPVLVPVSLPGANAPPSISLNSPAGGSVYVAPATIAMGAAAADTDGSVTRVDFYVGTTQVGSDTTSPYTFSWGNVPVGSYALKAVAVDNAGATAASSTVAVTVTTANKPPLVSLTSPASGSTFSAPATITLTASASDTDGTIQRVEFYNGSTLLGSDTTSPYSFTWLNVAAGPYSLRAATLDNLGASAVSSSSDITVRTSTLSKAIFSPAVVADVIQYYVFEVFAAGSDPSVAPPIATQNIGLPPLLNGECVANVQSTILSLVPGSYIATVSSVSDVEGKLRSAPFAFTR